MRSSPWRAWPETWTGSWAECSTSAPAAVQVVDDAADGELVARDRVRGEHHGVVGPEVERRACRRVASRDRADSGSPWEPVQSTSTSDGREALEGGGLGERRRRRRAARRGGGRARRSSASSARAARPCGPGRARRRGPAGCGAGATRSTRRSGDGPAAPGTGAAARARRIDSESVNPGSSAFVESASRSATPSSPSAASRARSVRRPSIGELVELEVPRVHDDALRGVQRQRERARHRVGDRDELDVARPDAPPLVVGDLDELGVLREPRLVEAVPREAQGRAPSRRSGR